MIRNYQSADLQTIMDIGNRAWQGIYRMFRERYGDELFNIIVPDEQTEKGGQIKNHCKEHPDWVYVCEESGKIAGFVTFTFNHKTKIGEIGNNAVDPDCGLKGIGQQMYKAVLERFRKEGMKYAQVGTGLDEAHAPARRAYERAGFTIQHEKVVYFKKL